MGVVDTELQLLDLDQTASIEEVRQAYKDLVMVWHPDRFCHNPRLQRKAEDKLKQFNQAYDHLRQWYERPQPERFRAARSPRKPPPPRRDRRQQQRSRPAGTPFSHSHGTAISFSAAVYVLQRYCFELSRTINATRQEYLSGPFILMVGRDPVEVSLSVPCHSLQTFDRILLSIPCKSSGHFVGAEAHQLLQLLESS